MDCIGEGQREGYNINMSLNNLIDYDSLLAVWDHVVLPTSKHFKTNFILVSAGFDAGGSSFSSHLISVSA